uniref:Uncharacterized protein n=1 Tax=Rhizophora mucronata TaxID=61149 RepID=A0A2P2PTA6_RHIMU
MQLIIKICKHVQGKESSIAASVHFYYAKQKRSSRY